MLEAIAAKGGTGIQEVTYNSVPDIQFTFLDTEWLLSVKLGESLGVIKSAFLQYMRHKEESGIEQGILLILPERMRRVRADSSAITAALKSTPVTALIDAGRIKTEYRDVPFSDVLDRLEVEIKKGRDIHYPIQFILDLLREQVIQMMEGLSVREEQLLRLVTDWELLTELAHVDQKQARDVARFLAAYVFLSQVLFLRLFASVHPDIVPDSRKISRSKLAAAFDRILDINYKPIFKLEVLDAIPDDFLTDTFILIWGMEVERVRFELPGRLFHALMPPHVRKLLAAFYTRPQAAELLSRLTLNDANMTTFDPACGSGTILTAAYRQKLQLHKTARLPGNPHKTFCEQQVFGADIMPFAVHLTCANLAAMDVAETIEKTLVVQGDSLEMVSGKAYEGGVHQLGLFNRALSALKTSGEAYEVNLPEGGFDSVVMNPPFTKVERRISDYVDMNKFKSIVGGEVGLWGHFITLADSLLKEGGKCGAVIPISILRGRESEKIRKFIFEHWTPKFLIKSTRSYAFSENAEYRDILFIADKKPARANDRVKVCYVKKHLGQVTGEDVERFADQIEGRRQYRSAHLDIDTHQVKDFNEHSSNMLWFLGTEDLNHRDALVQFCGLFKGKCEPFPSNYFGEGYRPVPKGVSKFLFLTRAISPSRIEEAFLRFTNDRADPIRASTAMGTEYEIEKSDLTPSLRTSVGLNRMDISGLHDYIAHEPYGDLRKVLRAAGHSAPLSKNFWANLQRELFAGQTKIVVARRLDFGSPNFHLTSWTSNKLFSPSNQVNIIWEKDAETAQAVCVLLNSIVFWAQFFLLKEQSHARYFDIRFYDLYEMQLYPPQEFRAPLAAIFARYRKSVFPSFRQQLDQFFEDRLREYWESQQPAKQQERFWTILNEPMKPSKLRMNFDREVCAAIGLAVSDEQLTKLYEVMAKEIILTRRLIKD